MDYWEEQTEIGKFWTSVWHVTLSGPHTKDRRSNEQNKLIDLLNSLLESGYPPERLAELAEIISLSHKIALDGEMK